MSFINNTLQVAAFMDSFLDFHTDSDVMALESTGEILTVSALNHAAKRLLEGTFGVVWVSGEISNFSVPSSGHWYFSIKDEHAMVRCVMFKGHNRAVSAVPSNGQCVIIKAKMSLYEGRGDFQLICEKLELQGQGALQIAYEALKKKLYQLGWFDKKYKKPLPEYPTSIGVITSPSGAAIRDILSVLRRRYKIAQVYVYPTPVQGAESIPGICKAIINANQHQKVDVIILSRGGGSLEDLWAFNDERVCFEIFKSKIPIITGIGHEIDTTISDYVADVRAPTPSAAAELCTKDIQDMLGIIQYYDERLQMLINQKLQRLNQQVTYLEKGLIHPKERLIAAKKQLVHLAKYMHIQMQHTLKNQGKRLSHLSSMLHTLSPLSTLERGYAIVRTNEHKVITKANEVSCEDKLKITLAKGEIEVVVEKTTMR